jgi:hypothetical protein
MGSQLDLDQGGTYRQYVRRFLGPSVGWVWTPEENILNVSSGGTTTILQGTTLVQVNVNGAVTIQLPSTKFSQTATAGALPGTFLKLPVTVVDIGGFAAANNITILPIAGQTIMSLASIKITAAYGGFTLVPSSEHGEWNTQ